MNLYNLYTEALEKNAKVSGRKVARTAAQGAAIGGVLGAIQGARNPGTKKDGTARSRMSGALRRGARTAVLGGAAAGALRATADSDALDKGVKKGKKALKSLTDKMPKTRSMKARDLKRKRKEAQETFSHFGDYSSGRLSERGKQLAALGALPPNVAARMKGYHPLAQLSASFRH